MHIDTTQRAQGISSVYFSDRDTTARIGVSGLPVVRQTDDFALSFWFRMAAGGPSRNRGVLRCGNIGFRVGYTQTTIQIIYDFHNNRHVQLHLPLQPWQAEGQPGRLARNTWYFFALQRRSGRLCAWLGGTWFDLSFTQPNVGGQRAGTASLPSGGGFALPDVGGRLDVGNLSFGAPWVRSRFRHSPYHGHIDDVRYYANIAPFNDLPEPVPEPSTTRAWFCWGRPSARSRCSTLPATPWDCKPQSMRTASAQRCS